MTPWSDHVLRVLEITVPVLLALYLQRRADKKDSNTKHEENQKRFVELFEERRYLVPHDHIEQSGTLTAEGIVRRRNGVTPSIRPRG